MRVLSLGFGRITRVLIARVHAAQTERYILHELSELDSMARDAFATYQFNKGESSVWSHRNLAWRADTASRR